MINGCETGSYLDMMTTVPRYHYVVVQTDPHNKRGCLLHSYIPVKVRYVVLLPLLFEHLQTSCVTIATVRRCYGYQPE